jgi:branched-chain amino acid transport system ATP-binding protein
VAETLRLASRRHRSRPDPEEVLELFPALRELLARRTGDLSGGEQQMLSLARALVGRPRVLLVDEMSMGLAPLVVGRLLAALRRVADEEGTAVVVVEQHVHLALEVADRAYVLQRGRVVLEGPARELARRPQTLEASYLGGQASRPLT